MNKKEKKTIYNIGFIDYIILNMYHQIIQFKGTYSHKNLINQWRIKAFFI